MSNRTTPKKVRIGYNLEVKVPHLTHTGDWFKVDRLFSTRDEAHAYSNRHYPEAPAHRILGVRMSAEKVGLRERE